MVSLESNENISLLTIGGNHWCNMLNKTYYITQILYRFYKISTKKDRFGRTSTREDNSFWFGSTILKINLEGLNSTKPMSIFRYAVKRPWYCSHKVVKNLFLWLFSYLLSRFLCDILRARFCSLSLYLNFYIIFYCSYLVEMFRWKYGCLRINQFSSKCVKSFCNS